jgi:pimeloyl-ACP methyl ester carboxylesterase
MERRGLLKRLGGVAGGAVLLREGDLLAASEHGRTPRAQARRSTFVEAGDGTPLFFRDCGRGRPIVFAAPWALHSSWWEYQTAALAGDGLRCVSYDRRGHGRSGWPAEGYEFDTLADDLAALIGRLDLRAITLVAHSMGAGEAVRYLTRHGAGRVARLVLVAPIGPVTLKTADNPDGVDRSVLEKGRQALSLDRPGQIAAAAAAFFGAPKNTVSAAMFDWWTRMIVHDCSLKVMLDLHRVFTETDFRPELRTIGVPTVIIHGDADVSTPLDRTGRPTAALVKGSELRVYEGAAHGLPITHMERLNRDLAALARG